MQKKIHLNGGLQIIHIVSATIRLFRKKISKRNATHSLFRYFKAKKTIQAGRKHKTVVKKKRDGLSWQHTVDNHPNKDKHALNVTSG